MSPCNESFPIGPAAFVIFPGDSRHTPACLIALLKYEYFRYFQISTARYTWVNVFALYLAIISTNWLDNIRLILTSMWISIVQIVFLLNQFQMKLNELPELDMIVLKISLCYVFKPSGCWCFLFLCTIQRRHNDFGSSEQSKKAGQSNRQRGRMKANQVVSSLKFLK